MKNIEYKTFDKYEGWNIRPQIVARGVQVTIDNNLKIRCTKYNNEAENKSYLQKLVSVLEENGLV